MTLANYRPRRVSEILDASIVFYRTNFLTILTIGMAVVVPPAILKFLIPNELDRLIDFLGNLLIFVGQGAIAAVVAASLERNQELSPVEAFGATAGKRGSLIAVQILSGLMLLVGLLLLLIPGVIAVVWTAVGVPVVMIDGLGYSKAVSRSRELARGNFGRVLGTLVLTWGLTILMVMGAGAVLGMFGSEKSALDLLIEVLFGVFFPVPAIAMTFLYYDLRVRNEGADMEAMLSDLPAPAPTP